jgi:mono/diheme cytochrome c family protein
MRKTLNIILSGLSIITFAQGQESTEVQELFKLKCAICHTIGGGKLIGPDLLNVQDRHPKEWLISFITSSQTMIKKGDSTAVVLFEEHNQVEMPDPLISVDEILALIDYIGEESARGGGNIQPYVSIIEDATPEDFESGQELFQGRKRFANKGPSCISCHNELSSSYFSENSYSTKDIRTSFSCEKHLKGIIYRKRKYMICWYS